MTHSAVVRRGRQPAGDVPQGHVGDAGVEHLHERRHGDRAAISHGLRPPAAGSAGGSRPAPVPAATGPPGRPGRRRRRRRRGRLAGRPGSGSGASARRPGPVGVVLVTDVRRRPTGRRTAGRRPGSASASSIRTGSRWTTLTKLPVAFSGGSSARVEPVPARTRPPGRGSTRPAYMSTSQVDRLADPQVGELGLLEVGVDPDVGRATGRPSAAGRPGRCSRG